MAAKKSSQQSKDLYVIGIGASAGGLEAINQFLSNVPDNSGFACIVVQHLSPDHKSLMSELLPKHTHMRVLEARNQMSIEANCVYLLPSKKTLTLKGNKLILKEKVKSKAPNNAIDLFFESLANEYGKNAVGVILSGTGTDGTLGIQAISEKGGIVVVQDPTTSAFDGMPLSAISTGLANLILPPQNMIYELTEYLNAPSTVRSLKLNTPDNEAVLQEIILLIKKISGYDFTYYKNPTLMRRLTKRMGELGIAKTADYYDYLGRNKAEMEYIAHHFLINVTNFFRDREAFEILQTEVIPEILKEKAPGDIVKVWVAACSTGEEAYSMSILFHEYMEKEEIHGVTLKIFATDIDKEAVEIASKGIYPRSILSNVTGQRMANYFEVEGDQYRIKPEIRKTVVFSYHDILKDPPYGRMDLISCRNMLIYITPEAQKEILKKLHFALNLNGYIIIGPSEHIDAIKPSLEEVNKKWRIFRCISKARLYETAPSFHYPEKRILHGSEQKKAKNPVNDMGGIFLETLIDDPSYAGILTDLQLDVKQAIGNYKRYLDLPDTHFNFNLLKLIHTDLGLSISVLVRKAVQDNRAVAAKNVRIYLENETRLIDVHVKPYLQNTDYNQQFLFVVFKETSVKEISDANATPRNPNSGIEHVRELETELRESRESLQAVIEEMEATNEELQSANEEMNSTNEELQSANEELQSLNEELHTVSAEHQLRIKELMDLNDDLNNYFSNSEAGQILVDKKLLIRRFTPSATRMVNLVSSDVNRSLLDITTRFSGTNFIEDISNVIKNGLPVEREVTLEDNVYLMRITPYERHDKRLDGVVINFIDITKVKRLDTMMQAVFKAVPNAIFALKAVRDGKKDVVDFEFTSVNSAAEKMLGQTSEQLVGSKTRLALHPSYNELRKIYKQVLDTGKPHNYDFFNEYVNKWSNIVVMKFYDGIISVATDITEKKRAAELVEKNYEELRKSLKLNKK